MVEQREVMGAAQVHAVLGAKRDPPLATAPGGARAEHQRVAEQAPERVVRRARERRRDEAVGRALQQRHLGTRGGAQRVRIGSLPIAVDERTIAQVADPGAAASQEAGERARLGYGL